MTKHLFFDDQRLYIRQGLTREYGVPETVGTFVDPHLTSPYGWSATASDGKVHLLYNGMMPDGDGRIVHGFGAAISDDGISFQTRDTAAESGFDNPLIPNQILPPSPTFSEIAAMVKDPFAPPAERYKILYADVLGPTPEWRIQDDVYVSPDLIRWHKLPNSCWNPYGTEPITGAFYNPVSEKFTILSRPGWGQRRVGVTETINWHDFSPLELSMQCDSLDEPLAEIYGMPAMEYDGWFVGFPLIYHGFPQEMRTKYSSGKMHAQLAYSLNGHYWQRSLRTPFINSDTVGDGSWAMTSPSSMLRRADGSVLIYVNACRLEHGTAPEKMLGNAAVKILRLRKDGFIRLAAHGKEEGIIALRDSYLENGSLSINILADHATCAIYKFGTCGTETWLSHDDCIPFSGDATNWTPQWRNGSVEALKGKLVNIEVRLRDGAIYSIAYDGLPLMNHEADIINNYGRIPLLRKGF